MPTYRVTDPNTGRTVKLTGDTPPTEQELEDVFKDLAPAAGGSSPATPMAAAPSSPLVAWNGITGSLIPKQTQLNAASAIAGSEQAPLNPELSRLPLLGPILDLARTLRETGSDVTQNLVNEPVATLRGFGAGAAEGVMDQLSPLNIALQALPYVRNLVKGAKAPVAVPPEVRVTGTGAVPVEPVPAGGGFSAPTSTAPGLPGPAPRPLPIEVTRTGTAAVPVDPVPLGQGRAPVVTSTGGWSMPAPRPAAPPVEQILKPPVKALPEPPAPVATPGPMSTLEQQLRASLAERAAVTGAGKTAAPIADVVSKHIDEAMQAGAEPAVVADAVERAVPQTVKEMVADMRRMFGSDKAGKMIYGESVAPKAARDAVERLAPGPSRHPLEAEVAALDRSFADKILDPRGAANPQLLQQLGGAAAGGAIGATQGDTTQDHVVNGLLGAGIGATAVPLITHLATTGVTRQSGSLVPKEAQSVMYGSILSSPTSVAKAYLGALGGTAAAAAEKIAAGDAASGARILRTLMSPQSVQTFVKALMNPQVENGMAADAPTVIGRIFSAGDAVAKRAMAAGGIGADEAARFTLAGVPTTQVGKDVLATFNKYFELRLFTTLFPRVGIQILERGLERSPAGLANLPGLNDGASAGLKLARAGMGTAAGIAGYAYSDQIPDWAKPYVAAVSGVYALPVSMGLAAGAARDLGKGAEDQLTGALSAFAGNLPFPQYGPTEGLKQFLSGSNFIPSAVRDIAVAQDPFERDTSGSMFDRTRAKLPGLREQLPVKGRRVNVAGDPITDRSTPFKRVFNPAPSKNAPFSGVPDAVKTEVQRLGIELNPPSFEKTVKVGRKEIAIPPDASERIQRERRQFLVPAIEKLLASPSYQSASDDVKKRRLNAAIQQAEERGAAKARVVIGQTLRSLPNGR